jgi:hypothetical protein
VQTATAESEIDVLLNGRQSRITACRNLKVNAAGGVEGGPKV